MLTINDVNKFINNNINLAAQSNNLQYRSVHNYFNVLFNLDLIMDFIIIMNNN